MLTQLNKQIVLSIFVVFILFAFISSVILYFLPLTIYYYFLSNLLISFLLAGLLILLIKRFTTEDNTQPVEKATKRIQIPGISRKSQLPPFGHYDKLTSLPDRFIFNRILNKSINHAKRHHKLLAVLILSIDNFKQINEDIGRRKANLVLKEVSIRLINSLRSDDIIARLDNDELIILLNDIKQAKYVAPVAEKILSFNNNPVKINDENIFYTMSIGIVVFPDDGDSLEALQMSAETALNSAKIQGGNRYTYHTKEIDTISQEYITLEKGLRKAITNNELILFFQPQYNLSDGSLKGVEALIRWLSPQFGVIQPEQFIPLAEETGLISSIGKWALNEACKINKAWQMQGYQQIKMAVNVSIKQFKGNLSKIIRDAIEHTQLEAKYLEIEITESEMITNIELTLSELSSIQQMGVNIAIDDFGTGFTSINYLRQIPLNTLKIDRSLIKHIETNKNERAIIKSVIELGHSLGLTIVAEGVESLEQTAFLRQHHCDAVQGYFFSRPIPEVKVINLLAKSKRSKN